MNPLIFVAVLSLQAPSPAPVAVPTRLEARLAEAAIVAHVAAQVADTITTVRAMESGRGREANPLLASLSPGRIALVKAAVATAVTVLTWKLRKKHPRLIAVTLGALSAGMSYVAYRNTQVGR
jgi:hypothetical protein